MSGILLARRAALHPAQSSRIVAFGTSGSSYSDDGGATWSSYAAISGMSHPNNAIFAAGQFVVVDSSNNVFTSPDGATWTKRTPSISGALYGIAYGAGLFVVVGQNGRLATSPDCITWTTRTSGFGSTDINGIAYGAGLFVITGANKAATSTDGITWTSQSARSSYETHVFFANGWFLQGGSYSGASKSADGLSWSSTSAYSSSATTNPSGFVYGGGIYAAATNDGQMNTSTDLSTWTNRTSAISVSNVFAVVYSGALFAGCASSVVAKSADGSSWSKTTIPSIGNIRAIASSGT